MSTNQAIEEAFQFGKVAGRNEERAAIVAGMRGVADQLVAMDDQNGLTTIGATALRTHADQIEARGAMTELDKSRLVAILGDHQELAIDGLVQAFGISREDAQQTIDIVFGSLGSP